MSLKFDQIQTFDNGTAIQHGKYNDRIYLMKKGDVPVLSLILQLKQIAEENQYSKIFAKSKATDLPVYIDQGFTVEAIIPSCFNGKHDLFLACYYLKDERRHEVNSEKYTSILNLAKSKAGEIPSSNNNVGDFTIRACQPEDIPEMTSIYRKVFLSYPFPIHDPTYLRKTMDKNVDYYCAERNGNILALSSAENDYASKSAEMTDFATLQGNRGNGCANQLLTVMEKESSQKGIKTLYTIARAISPGMNITFSRLGFTYGGRLKNNTNIAGKIESMNIWYKNI